MMNFLDRLTVNKCARYLIRSNSVNHPNELPVYYQFVRFVFYDRSVSYVQSLISEYVGYGCNELVLRQLALMLGVVLP